MQNSQKQHPLGQHYTTVSGVERNHWTTNQHQRSPAFGDDVSVLSQVNALRASEHSPAHLRKFRIAWGDPHRSPVGGTLAHRECWGSSISQIGGSSDHGSTRNWSVLPPRVFCCIPLLEQTPPNKKTKAAVHPPPSPKGVKCSNAGSGSSEVWQGAMSSVRCCRLPEACWIRVPRQSADVSQL